MKAMVFIVPAFLAVFGIGCAHRPGAHSTPAGGKRVIVLLDLNYTLVGNREESLREGRGDPGRRIAHERYREWLLDLVRRHRVILITARPESQKAQTLSRIMSTTGWQPDESYFNEKNLPPPECKKDILERYVFPKHGAPEKGAQYAAIESNPRTAAMYASLGIPGLRIWEAGQYRPEIQEGEGRPSHSPASAQSEVSR